MDSLIILYIINFFDSVSLGLIIPILTTHILNLGGSHTILGLHATLHLLLQFFAGPLVRTLVDLYGKKRTLLITLSTALITNILMGQCTSYTLVIVIRLLYYVTNRTEELCKEFFVDHKLKENLKDICSNLILLNLFGFIIGPILGGCIYEYDNGFAYLSLITGLLSILSIFLSFFLPNDPRATSKKVEKTSLFQKIEERLVTFKNGLQDIDMKKYRAVLALRILTTISLTALFIKFSLLLRVHYNFSHTAVGVTVAYQHFITSVSVVAAPAYDTFTTLRGVNKLKQSLPVLTITIAATCFAPTYIVYYLSYVAMNLAQSVVHSAYKDIEEIEKLSSAIDTVTTITKLLVPIPFGYLCDMYKHSTVKLCAVLPLIIATIIANYFAFPKNVPIASVKKEK